MIPIMFRIPFHLRDVDLPDPAIAFYSALLFCLLSSYLVLFLSLAVTFLFQPSSVILVSRFPFVASVLAP
jgi:exosortase/archaeosortase